MSEIAADDPEVAATHAHVWDAISYISIKSRHFSIPSPISHFRQISAAAEIRSLCLLVALQAAVLLSTQPFGNPSTDCVRVTFPG